MKIPTKQLLLSNFSYLTISLFKGNVSFNGRKRFVLQIWRYDFFRYLKFKKLIKNCYLVVDFREVPQICMELRYCLHLSKRSVQSFFLVLVLNVAYMANSDPPDQSCCVEQVCVRSVPGLLGGCLVSALWLAVIGFHVPSSTCRPHLRVVRFFFVKCESVRWTFYSGLEFRLLYRFWWVFILSQEQNKGSTKE